MRLSTFGSAFGVTALAVVTGVLALGVRDGRGESGNSATAVMTAPSSTASQYMPLLPTPTPSGSTGSSPSLRRTTAVTTPSARPDLVQPAPLASAVSSTQRATSNPTPSSLPSASTSPSASRLPLSGYTGDATQVITVRSSGWSATRGTLQAWTRVAGGWKQYGPSVAVWLGAQGMTTHPNESLSATPAGDFPITQAFGNNVDPGTSLPYFHVDSKDWWVSDPTSSVYNTHQRCVESACTFHTEYGEHLIDVGWVYGYAVVINANMNPVVKGAGSAFFLHVSNGAPTAGCVSMPQADLVQVLRWLTPADHPRFIIGVG